MLKLVFNLIMEITYATSVNLDATDKEIGIIEDFDELIKYQKASARKWEYINDKWYGIRNHISPPPMAINHDSGDCDDFASKVYQAGQKYNPFLLTYFPKVLTRAHTITVLKPELGKYKGQYVVMNWSRTKYFNTLEEVKNYCEGYANSKITSFHWAKYNYETGRFETVKEKDIK